MGPFFPPQCGHILFKFKAVFLNQALVISHEGAKVEDLDTYLADKLAPLQPIILWGRTASAMPAVPKEQAVYYWWKARSSINQGQTSFFHNFLEAWRLGSDVALGHVSRHPKSPRV